MQVTETTLPGVKILTPKVFADTRGFFFESYNHNRVTSLLGLDANTQFVQDNHSHSIQGVLRGLHYQLNHVQGKLVRVISGEIYDVAVDLRPGPSCGKWVGVYLSASTHQMLWVPPGFAHGFLVLSPTADVLYKTTDFYDPTSEHTILWNDPDLSITWPFANTSTPNLSPKDGNGKSFREAPKYS